MFIFQATGIGGDPKLGHKTEAVTTMMPVRDRPVTVIFNADRHAAMQWNFKPAQDRVTVSIQVEIHYTWLLALVSL